jgi:hypothetical protein
VDEANAAMDAANTSKILADQTTTDNAVSNSLQPITANIPKVSTSQVVTPRIAEIPALPVVNNIAPRPVENVIQPIVAPPTVAAARVAEVPATPAPVVNNFQTVPTTDAVSTQPAQSGYQNAYDQSLNRLQDVAGGNSDIDRKIADQNLRRYDTQAANDLAVANQRNTLQSNIPDSARSALGAEAQSAVRSGRSELVGNLAAGEQQRALAANSESANLALQGLNYEEGKRRYNQEFEQGKIQWDDQKQQWEKTFSENVRQFDTQFAEDKRRYGDTQAWNAYTQALQVGSDADVVAAYKTATGKDLDPAAVTEYRGAVRTVNQQAIQKGALELQNMKTSKAGADLSAYVQNNSKATVANDPALRNAAQAYWESTGNTGVVPESWANERVTAIRDAGNAIVTFNHDIDYAVSEGQIKSEDAEMLKKINSTGLLQFYKTDETGKVVFDWDAMAKAMGQTTTGSGTGTVTGTGEVIGQAGIKVSIPKDDKGVPTKWNGDYFYGEDGNLYTVSEGEPETASLSKLILAKDWTRISELEKSNPDKVLKEIPAAQYTLNDKTGTDKIKTNLRENDVTKIKIGDKEVAVKVSRLGKIDRTDTEALFGLSTSSYDGAFIEFVDSNGKYYYQEVQGGKKSGLIVGRPKDGNKGSIETKYVGGNQNIE